MRQSISCLCILVVLTAAYAVHGQGGSLSDYYGPYRFDAGQQCVVFSDTANLRTSPSATAAIADTVFAFEQIKIVEATGGLLTVGRKQAPWYKVRYRKAGKERTAYLWGGALALHHFRKDGVQIACGLLSYPMADGWMKDEQPEGASLRDYNTFSIKAATGRGFQECRYNVFRESAFFHLPMDTNGVELPAARPITGSIPPSARWMTAYNMSGEACGIPGYQLSAAWDGHRLIRMPLLQGVSDAGVYYYDERYIFPDDEGGKRGLLRIRCEASEAEDDDGERMKVTVTWREYRWDGNGWR